VPFSFGDGEFQVPFHDAGEDCGHSQTRLRVGVPRSRLTRFGVNSILDGLHQHENWYRCAVRFSESRFL
jgi:hypothetical protein